MNKTLKYAFIGIFCALLIAAAAALFIARAYWHGDGLGFGKNYVAERLDLDRGQRDLFSALSSELFAIRDDLRAQQRGALRDALALLAAERRPIRSARNHRLRQLRRQPRPQPTRRIARNGAEHQGKAVGLGLSIRVI